MNGKAFSVADSLHVALTTAGRQIEEARVEREVKMIMAYADARWAHFRSPQWDRDEYRALVEGAVRKDEKSQAWKRVLAEPTVELQAAAYLRAFPNRGLSLEQGIELFRGVAKDRAETEAAPEVYEVEIDD